MQETLHSRAARRDTPVSPLRVALSVQFILALSRAWQSHSNGQLVFEVHDVNHAFAGKACRYASKRAGGAADGRL